MGGMKLIPYVCTHCGRRFEAEEKGILECPGCFWSTSVKKEEELREQKEKKPSAEKGPPPQKSFSMPISAQRLKTLFLGVTLLALASSAVLILGRFFEHFHFRS